MLDILSFGDGGWGDEYARATWLVVKLALASLAVGTVLGLLGAWAKLSRSRAAQRLADAYTTVIRGVPELLVIWIVFFGTSIGLQKLFALFGQEGYVEIDAFASGTLALSVVFGAFATEVFRGAFLAIPRGQIEAAKALGMGRSLVFRRIQFPQMVRYATPGLGNLWLVLLKDTSLVSVIALDELIRTSRIAGEAMHEPFTFYFIAAMIYLGLTIVSMGTQQRIETWANRGVERA